MFWCECVCPRSSSTECVLFSISEATRKRMKYWAISAGNCRWAVKLGDHFWLVRSKYLLAELHGSEVLQYLVGIRMIFIAGPGRCRWLTSMRCLACMVPLSVVALPSTSSVDPRQMRRYLGNRLGEVQRAYRLQDLAAAGDLVTVWCICCGVSW